MPSKFVIVIKIIIRMWSLFLIVVILIIAIYNHIAAIVIAGISISLFLLTYIPRFYLKRKLVKFMKNYYRIEDDFIATKLKRSLRKIQDKMFNLLQKQKSKNFLIVFLNKHYIFYHEQTIEKFKKLYNKGYSDKEMLEILKENDLKTRDEVKAITETLIKNNRLERAREISVKERLEKQRFKNL